jgi:transcriptional regulator with XRE-family HTH domain
MREELNPEQIQFAYRLWRQNYPHLSADDAVEPFLRPDLKSSDCPFPGWLRMSRLALFLSMDSVAAEMGITKAAYAMFEKNEEHGTITLQSLSRAAEAMNCELVYALRPKKRMRYSEMVWTKLVKLAATHAQVTGSAEKLKPRALAGMAKLLMMDPKTRGRLGWLKRF